VILVRVKVSSLNHEPHSERRGGGIDESNLPSFRIKRLQEKGGSGEGHASSNGLAEHKEQGKLT